MVRLTGFILGTAAAALLAGVAHSQTGLPVAPPDKAILLVYLPASAKLTVDGVTTSQAGPERKFITPVLESGVIYSQEFVVHWHDKQMEYVVKKAVDFSAGQTIVVDLTPGRPLSKLDPQKAELVKKTTPDKKEAAPDKIAGPPEKKETVPEKSTPNDPKTTEPEKKTLAEPKKTEPEKTTPAEPKKTAPGKTTPAELKKTAPEKTTPAEPKKTAPEKTTPAEPKKTEPEKRTPAEPKKTETKPAPEISKAGPEPKAPTVANTAPPKTTVKEVPPRTRTFQFTYAARIQGLPAGVKARVWLPLATSNDEQEVTIVERILGDAKVAKDTLYGNTIAYFEATANAKGYVPFEITYLVKRKEVRFGANAAATLPARQESKRYLQPNARAPWAGKPLDFLRNNLAGGMLPREALGKARTIYDVLARSLTHKSVGVDLGHGDTARVVENRYGNSLDLNSLYVALARGNDIPAKLELGFRLPSRPGVVTTADGWAWVLPEGQPWLAVDLADAGQTTGAGIGNLTADRVTFSVGRDIELVPRQAGPPLNYFLDPYVEVNGQAYPANKVQRRYSFREVP